MSQRLRVDPTGEGLWGLANRILVVLIALALLAGAALSYLPLIQQNRDLRERLERNRAQLSALQTELRTLQSTVNALQKDKRTVERAARERGMARTGETIIKFEAPPRPETNGPAPGRR
jgi:cell division protein FtsB